MGCCSSYEYPLLTLPHEIFNRRAYRLSVSEKILLQAELEKMLRLKVIRPSSSPYSSPIFLIPKKDGTARFVLDARFINKVIQGDQFPLPHIRDLFDRLKGYKVFSHLDLRSGYWQVNLREGDRALTAFQTPEGLFEFCVMPFGVKTAPAAFQRLIQQVFAPVHGRGVLCYIDDIILYSMTDAEHFQLLRQVFQLLNKAHLSLHPNKCLLFQSSIHLLGHVISENGISVDPAKIDAMVNFPKPSNKSELSSFLGLTNYYHQFVNGFAKLAAPLYHLTSSNVEWEWNGMVDDSFNSLKQALTQAPILQQPDYTRPFIIISDASMLGVGAVLGQSEDFTYDTMDRTWSAVPEQLRFVVISAHQQNVIIVPLS